MSFDSNIDVYREEGYGVITINPDIFSLEVIYSATYTYLDKAYFIFEGSPEEEILVKYKPKEDQDIKKLGYKIQNELLNYAVYIIQASRNKEIRNAIISRALGSNQVETRNEKDSPVGVEDDFVKDEKGIADTWSPEQAEGLEEDDS